VDLKVGYDFYDSDIDLKSGSVSRYSIGLEFFPIAGVEVRPVYRIVKTIPRTSRTTNFSSWCISIFEDAGDEHT